MTRRAAGVNGTVAWLTARSLLGRRRALLLLTVPAALLGLSVLARVVVGADPELAVFLLGSFALGTVGPLLGLIAGTGAIAPEIDDGSIVHLLAKPLSRHVIATTEVAVALAVVTVLGALPTLLAGLVLTDTADGLVGVPLLVAVVVGCTWGAGHRLRSLRLTSEA